MLRKTSAFIISLVAFLAFPVLALAYGSFTASSVSYNHSTGAYSFHYSSYAGNSPVYTSIRYDQNYSNFDWSDTTPSCSGGTCTGTFSGLAGTNPGCSGWAYLHIWDGSNDYVSQVIAISSVDSTCGATSTSFTASSVSYNHSTGAYAFDYSTYSGNSPVYTSVRYDQNYSVFDWSDTTPSCSGGHCSGTFSGLTGTNPNCSGSVYVHIWDGSNDYLSQSMSIASIDSSCRNFTGSSVSYNHSTGAYSFSYSSYVGNSPVYASIRYDQNYSVFDWSDTTPSCSGGTCTGTFSGLAGSNPGCSGSAYLHIWDGTNDYLSQVMNISHIDSSCRSFTGSSVSYNHSTGAYSFNYSSYYGSSPVYASIRYDASASSFDWSDTTPSCSGGACSGTFTGLAGSNPGCTGSAYLHIWDGTSDYVSGAMTIQSIDSSCP